MSHWQFFFTTYWTYFPSKTGFWKSLDKIIKLQYVENNSQGKNVAFWGISFNFVSGLDFQHLRCYISRGSASHIKILLLIPILSKSQIYDHWKNLIWILGIFFNHNILQFEIPVHDALFMHVVDTLQKSFHNLLDLNLVWETVFL